MAADVADALERLLPELRERALIDVMTDGSRKAIDATDILEVVIRDLRGGGELLKNMRRAVSASRERSDDVDFLLEVLRQGVTRAEADETERQDRERRGLTRMTVPDAPDERPAVRVAAWLTEAMVGSAECFRILRPELPGADDLDALRPDLAEVLEDRLALTDRDELWAEATLRAVFRVWRVPSATAEGLLDFLRKRAKK